MSGNNLTCLNNDREVNMINDELPALPGIFYDLNDQCRLSYGANSIACKSHKVRENLDQITDAFHEKYIKKKQISGRVLSSLVPGQQFLFDL